MHFYLIFDHHPSDVFKKKRHGQIFQTELSDSLAAHGLGGEAIVSSFILKSINYGTMYAVC